MPETGGGDVNLFREFYHPILVVHLAENRWYILAENEWYILAEKRWHIHVRKLTVYSIMRISTRLSPYSSGWGPPPKPKAEGLRPEPKVEGI